MSDYNYRGSNLSLEQLKSLISEEISLVRSVTLDKFQKHSPGVSRVYSENIIAAQRFMKGSVELMSNGMTPTDYLHGFGQKLGLHASQFAAYVLYENQRLGIQAYEVEKRYLEGRGLLASSIDGNVIITWFDSYRDYCNTISGI